jgi:hypothetical protein
VAVGAAVAKAADPAEACRRLKEKIIEWTNQPASRDEGGPEQ